MNEERNPFLEGVLSTLAAITLGLWLAGMVGYWGFAWGPSPEENPIIAVYSIVWLPLITLFVAGMLYAEWRFSLLQNHGWDVMTGVVGLTLWALTLVSWQNGYWGPADEGFGWLLTLSFPLLYTVYLIVRHPRGTWQRLRDAGQLGKWGGNLILHHFRLFMILGGIIVLVSLMVGLLTWNWAPLVFVVVIPMGLVLLNWARNLVLGFNLGDSLKPTECEVITDNEGKVVSPQHIHPIGIWDTAVERARGMAHDNPLFLPHESRGFALGWQLVRWAIVGLWFWLVFSKLAANFPGARFPMLMLDSFWTAVVGLLAFVAFTFGGRQLQIGWSIILAPIWSLGVLGSLAVLLETNALWVLWPFTLVPHIVYSVTVWTRSIFSFGEGRIWVTYPKFYWWGISTEKGYAPIKEFGKARVETKRTMFGTYGKFDPGIVKLGDEEVIIATHVPDPDGLSWALMFLQARDGGTE
jgi:hypothetical protein